MRKTAIIVGALALTMIFSGCMFQADIDGTGTVEVLLGPADTVGGSALIGTDDLDPDGYVRIFLLNGTKYYNTANFKFQNDVFASEIPISGYSSTSITFEDLPPGNKYQIFLAVGERSTNGQFLRVYKFASAGPFSVSAGNTTQITPSNTTESGLNYADVSIAAEVASIVTLDSENIYALAGTTILSGAWSVNESEYQFTDSSISVGFDPKSLGVVKAPGDENETLLVNGTAAEGIIQWTGSIVNLGAAEYDDSGSDSALAAILQSDYLVRDDDIVIFYQSEAGVGVGMWEADGTLPLDWMDVAAEAGSEIPEGIDLSSLIQDYALTDDFAVISTSEFGTLYASGATIDEFLDDGEGDGSYFSSYSGTDGSGNEVDIFYIVSESRFTAADTVDTGEEVIPYAVEIGSNPLDLLGTFSGGDYEGEKVLSSLQSISLPDYRKVRSLEVIGNDLILLGSDIGVFAVDLIQNATTEALEVTTNSEGLADVALLPGSLEVRVQAMEANGSRAAVLYGNGTIDIVDVANGTAAISTAKRRPFYAGLPGLPSLNSDAVLESSINSMAWADENTLMVAGIFGIVSYNVQ